MIMIFKGRKLPTLSDGFNKASKVFADNHLLWERRYPTYLDKVIYKHYLLLSSSISGKITHSVVSLVRGRKEYMTHINDI